MSILLLAMLYSPRVMGTAQPLQPSPQAHLIPPVTHLISNATITCVFNGVQYFVSSPSPNMITCESILRDATMSVANSANDRTVTGILWSCLATVFACTWVSVHPNIPHPDATEWQIRRHRFFMMLCGLIAPELIVLWALRQWIGARLLVTKMKEKHVEGFTAVHGHFMQMGGFMLYSKGARVGVIEDYNLLISCIMDWKFVLPTAEEIRDRSKGDGLSKALVVGQTGWFVAQCLSRWITGLAITEVELMTLAFATLNGIIYFLWWNKPLDVRYAVQVVRHTEDHGPDDGDLPYSYNSSQNAFITTTISAESFRDSGWKIRLGDDLQNIRWLVANSRIGRLLPALKPYLNQGDAEGVDRRLRISVLHSNCDSQDTFAATAVASAIGILFGAVHCIAWNFHFLSHQERILWHVWSAIITTMPVVLFAKSVVSYTFIRRLLDDDDLSASYRRKGIITSWISRALLGIIRQISRPSIWLTVILVPVYIVARIGLLVQALVDLRNLQLAERAQVQWVKFVPHL